MRYYGNLLHLCEESTGYYWIPTGKDCEWIANYKGSGILSDWYDLVKRLMLAGF